MKHASRRAETETSHGPIPEAEKRIRLLIGGRLPTNLIDGTYVYRRLDREWFSFNERLAALDGRIDQSLRSALEVGSLLCGTGSQGRVQLVHPSQTNEIDLKKSRTDLHFVFSRDLPRAWMLEDMDLHQRRNEAGRWMVRAYRYFAAQGRRAGRDQLIEVAMDKYVLKWNAGKQAWKNVRDELGNLEGNIPSHMRVNINEIRQIE